MLRKAGQSVVIGAALSESFRAVRYYQFVGWPPSGELYSSKRLRLIEGPGEYRPAPFWQPEIGAIALPKDGSMTEFTLLHEIGHSHHPWRLVDTVACAAIMGSTRLWQGVAAGWTLLWSAHALSERLADFHALQHCSVDGLQKAHSRFGNKPLADFWELLLDTHFSDSRRVELIQKRIDQLETCPDTDPASLPLDVETFPFNLF